jgi:hypothetical protein
MPPMPPIIPPMPPMPAWGPPELAPGVPLPEASTVYSWLMPSIMVMADAIWAPMGSPASSAESKAISPIMGLFMTPLAWTLSRLRTSFQPPSASCSRTLTEMSLVMSIFMVMAAPIISMSLTMSMRWTLWNL